MSDSGGPSPWGTPGGNSSGSGGGGGAGGPARRRRTLGKPGGPFGGRPGGPGPGPLPDLDALIARLQSYIRSLLGGGGPRARFTGGRGLALIGLGRGGAVAGERHLPCGAR